MRPVIHEQTMNYHSFSFGGAVFHALPSGSLWWPEQSLLCVSDLHLGKAERMARRNGQPVPPYETQDTLSRLEADIEACDAKYVICLGDSFDDLYAAQALREEDRLWIATLQAGRKWVWIEGNHDPGPVNFGGAQLQVYEVSGITFRHIATKDACAEVSGHYHPKVQLPTRGRMITRPAYLYDQQRLVLPAYGTYTGGLRSDDTALKSLMAPDALAILTGPVPTCVPMPR